MIRPPRLRPGDAVAVVAPAGPVPRDRLAAGVARLASRYRLLYTERLFAKSGFLAGPDDERLAELLEALRSPEVRAVFCARGGYGLLRLLPRLPADVPARLVVGFSDATVLHAWAARGDMASVHGPVLTQLGDLPPEDAEALIALCEHDGPPPPLTGLRVLHPGRAEGRLVGGNLEMVSRLCGTPWAFDLEGAVLLLEDVGERPYRIDRALTQLALAGALRGLRGVVLGDFVGCAEKDHSPPAAEEVILERLRDVPIVAGAPIGHGARNRAIPHGARARIDGDTLTFLDGAVS